MILNIEERKKYDTDKKINDKIHNNYYKKLKYQISFFYWILLDKWPHIS